MHRCCIRAMTTFYTYPEHTPETGALELVEGGGHVKEQVP